MNLFSSVFDPEEIYPFCFIIAESFSSSSKDEMSPDLDLSSSKEEISSDSFFSGDESPDLDLPDERYPDSFLSDLLSLNDEIIETLSEVLAAMSLSSSNDP